MTTRGQILAALTAGDGQLEDEVTAEIANGDVIFLRVAGRAYPLVGLHCASPAEANA